MRLTEVWFPSELLRISKCLDCHRSASLLRSFGRQYFDCGKVLYELLRNAVSRSQVLGAVVGNPNLSEFIFGDQNLQRQIERYARRLQHHGSSHLWAAEYK